MTLKILHIPNQLCCSSHRQKLSTKAEESRCSRGHITCFPVVQQSSGSPDGMEIGAKGCPCLTVPTCYTRIFQPLLSSPAPLASKYIPLGGMMLPEQDGHMEKPQVIQFSVKVLLPTVPTYLTTWQSQTARNAQPNPRVAHYLLSISETFRGRHRGEKNLRLPQRTVKNSCFSKLPLTTIKPTQTCMVFWIFGLRFSAGEVFHLLENRQVLKSNILPSSKWRNCIQGLIQAICAR